MQSSNFIFKNTSLLPKLGCYKAEAPSNIALVKYWGKHGEQLPTNTSISFTLNECKTKTEVHLLEKIEADDQFHFEVYFNNYLKPDFKPKIKTFLKRIEIYAPFLKSFKFEIRTQNTFPHSSGIASSASGMAALAKCILQMEQNIFVDLQEDFLVQKASFLARLGSGSASRSTNGGLVVWGEHSSIENSSNFYGIDYPYEVHDNFKSFCDTILLVDQGKKEVSSSVGHNLMHNHPFASQRFKQADDNIEKIKAIFESGDLMSFINLIEFEALSLHAMMMTSQPYFLLMQPNTLEIINAIWAFRKETQTPVGFTLDAGANVHLLYPKSSESKVLDLIEQKLKYFCQNQSFIKDYVKI
ncbi:diphosphomevalonate decarboxylase [Psychroflexus aestuariivivens]|uniref:diphosphomevalonate decarboxylase n=1 Tax=Psychroflexus aestuariivivens TaxID=1795040 RepID=UPI000FDC1ADE|nr:diphosphomevalonate decarboxylase [Psychroflexus aestuariivivens]